jgi:predicted ester cyclase
MTTKELLRNGAPPTDLEERARWAFGLLGRRDLSRAEDIWAPEAVDHFLPVGDAIGRDGIVEFFEEMFAALPDLEIEVERVLVSAPFLVVQWKGTGTFAGGPFQGIRATGRRVEFRGCDVVEMNEDELVLENTIYWDNLAFARQIGMLPAKDSLADRLMTRVFNGITWVRTFGGRTLSVS